MIEELGVVTAVSADHIWVETQIKTTCSGCEQNTSCGTGMIAKTVASKSQMLKLACREQAVVGQQAKLGLPEQTLVGVSALFYLFPLFVMIIVGAITEFVSFQLSLDNEALSIISSLGALIGSFYIINRWLKGKKSESYQPQLLSLLPIQQPDIPVKLV